MTIEAHRPDFVPYLFKTAAKSAADDGEFLKIYKQFAGVLMIIWPSIGGPLCVSPQLSLAKILDDRGLKEEDIKSLSTRLVLVALCSAI